jgi:hypothetical protein
VHNWLCLDWYLTASCPTTISIKTHSPSQDKPHTSQHSLHQATEFVMFYTCAVAMHCNATVVSVTVEYLPGPSGLSMASKLVLVGALRLQTRDGGMRVRSQG